MGSFLASTLAANPDLPGLGELETKIGYIESAGSSEP